MKEREREREEGRPESNDLAERPALNNATQKTFGDSPKDLPVPATSSSFSFFFSF